MGKWSVWNVLGAVLVTAIFLEVLRAIELARRMRRAAQARALLLYLRACGYGQLDEQDENNDSDEKAGDDCAREKVPD